MTNNVYSLDDYRKRKEFSTIFVEPIDNSIKQLFDLNEEDREILIAMKKILQKEIIFD